MSDNRRSQTLIFGMDSGTDEVLPIRPERTSRSHDHGDALRPDLLQGQKINLRHVFAGQGVGVTQVGERIWLVTFMQYDLGYFDDETCRLEPIENPFGAKLLPIRSE